VPRNRCTAACTISQAASRPWDVCRTEAGVFEDAGVLRTRSCPALLLRILNQTESEAKVSPLLRQHRSLQVELKLFCHGRCAND